MRMVSKQKPCTNLSPKSRLLFRIMPYWLDTFYHHLEKVFLTIRNRWKPWKPSGPRTRNAIKLPVCHDEKLWIQNPQRNPQRCRVYSFCLFLSWSLTKARLAECFFWPRAFQDFVRQWTPSATNPVIPVIPVILKYLTGWFDPWNVEDSGEMLEQDRRHL